MPGRLSDTVCVITGTGGSMGRASPLDTYERIDVLFNLAATSCFNWFEDITNDEWDHARRGEVDLVFIVVDGGMKVW